MEIELNDLFNEKKFETLFIKIHSLKSNAIYIGAMDLYEQSAELEKELEPYKHDLDSVNAEVNASLKALLNKVTEPLKSLNKSLSAVMTEKKESDESLQMNIKLKDYLINISPLLKSSDFSVEQYMPSILTLVKGSPLEVQIQQLVDWVEDVEFEKATALTEQLLSNLSRNDRDF